MKPFVRGLPVLRQREESQREKEDWSGSRRLHARATAPEPCSFDPLRMTVLRLGVLLGVARVTSRFTHVGAAQVLATKVPLVGAGALLELAPATRHSVEGLEAQATNQ